MNRILAILICLGVLAATAETASAEIPSNSSPAEGMIFQATRSGEAPGAASITFTGDVSASDYDETFAQISTTDDFARLTNPMDPDNAVLYKPLEGQDEQLEYVAPGVYFWRWIDVTTGEVSSPSVFTVKPAAPVRFSRTQALSLLRHAEFNSDDAFDVVVVRNSCVTRDKLGHRWRCQAAYFSDLKTRGYKGAASIDLYTDSLGNVTSRDVFFDGKRITQGCLDAKNSVAKCWLDRLWYYSDNGSYGG